LNELDDPVPVAVDSFGSVYIAELAGQLQRVISNCALSTPYFGAVSRVASDTEGNIYFSDPQHSVVWRLPAAPPPSRGPPTVPLHFRRLHNSRAEAETDDAPPPIASRDVILPSQYDSA
jgi:hypothetical protein